MTSSRGTMITKLPGGCLRGKPQLKALSRLIHQAIADYGASTGANQSINQSILKSVRDLAQIH